MTDETQGLIIYIVFMIVGAIFIHFGIFDFVGGLMNPGSPVP